ncbi:hypothetical protein VP01_58g1 [Puccinia sorghi]|uniref:Uncharacterized protein n=1 Tax=Puccinia sorghi TaxID=27349 RepID=A0A0L6UHV5_9BASI|nr:hypothetical protein VP01_58g1 [Puccinia sorghi]
MANSRQVPQMVSWCLKISKPPKNPKTILFYLLLYLQVPILSLWGLLLSSTGVGINFSYSNCIGNIVKDSIDKSELIIRPFNYPGFWYHVSNTPTPIDWRAGGESELGGEKGTPIRLLFLLLVGCKKYFIHTGHILSTYCESRAGATSIDLYLQNLGVKSHIKEDIAKSKVKSQRFSLPMVLKVEICGTFSLLTSIAWMGQSLISLFLFFSYAFSQTSSIGFGAHNAKHYKILKKLQLQINLQGFILHSFILQNARYSNILGFECAQIILQPIILSFIFASLKKKTSSTVCTLIHSHFAVCTVTLHQSLVASLWEKGGSNTKSFIANWGIYKGVEAEDNPPVVENPGKS